MRTLLPVYPNSWSSFSAVLQTELIAYSCKAAKLGDFTLHSKLWQLRNKQIQKKAVLFLWKQHNSTSPFNTTLRHVLCTWTWPVSTAEYHTDLPCPHWSQKLGTFKIFTSFSNLQSSNSVLFCESLFHWKGKHSRDISYKLWNTIYKPEIQKKASISLQLNLFQMQLSVFQVTYYICVLNYNYLGNLGTAQL